MKRIGFSRTNFLSILNAMLEGKAKIPVIIILGPTAAGKTAVSVELARLWDAEIVSADSRLVYRGLDIGTAKPTRQERGAIRHHLIDIINPDIDFTVAEFKKLALEKLWAIHESGKQAIVSGGTGLYIRAIVENLTYQEFPPDEKIRAEIMDEINLRGSAALHSDFAEFDPEAAAKIHPNNIRRLVRAIEVTRITGRKFSDGIRADLESANESRYDFKLIGLNMDRELLYSLINERVDRMFDAGWVDEVRDLVADGYTGNERSFTGLGYREIMLYLNGKLTLRETAERVKTDTRRFAKRQLTWFNGMKNIQWIELKKDYIPKDIAAGIYKEYC